MLQNIQKQNHRSASLCSLIRRDLLSTVVRGPRGNMEPFLDQQTVGEISFWQEENLISVQKCGKIVEQQRHHLALWGA